MGLEELYERCDELAGIDRQEFLVKIQNVPKVPVSPHIDNPGVFCAAWRALSRAGYDSGLLDSANQG